MSDTRTTTIGLLLGGMLLVCHGGERPLAAQTSAESEVETPAGISPAAAFTASVLGTVVPAAAGFAARSPELFGVGVVLGPATGYWLAGAAGEGWRGVGLRAGTGLVGGLVMAATWGDDWTPSDDSVVAGTVVMAVLAALVVRDITRVDDVVAGRRAAESGSRKDESFVATPVVSPAGGGTVGVVGRLRL